MKRLQTGFIVLLSSWLPACGQQLVEFGHGVTVTDDLPMSLGDALVSDGGKTSDAGMVSDIGLSSDLGMVSDMPLLSDLALDLLTPADMHRPLSPSAMCAAMLGTAQTFAVIGGQTVTNTGATAIIGGNAGVWPGNAITGLPPGMPIGGSIHAGDAVAMQAQSDVTNSYLCTKSAVCEVELTGKDLGGLTLLPKVYCFSSSASQLAGTTLILDAQGDPEAVWVFQIASTLTVLDGAHIHVINGGKDCNVLWQIGSSATIGKSTRVAGNILALASITLNTGATVSGRVLSRNGSVTMDTNDIDIGNCGKGTPPPPNPDGGMLPDGGSDGGLLPDGGSDGGLLPDGAALDANLKD